MRSFDYLWCIGPSVRGAPEDDPKAVDAIRAAKNPDDLARWLASDSAQYRYEAVKRVGEGGGGMAENVATRLRTLAESDPYAEIRAATLHALGMGMNKPGWEALRSSLAARADGVGRLNDQDAFLTLLALRDAAGTALAGMLAREDTQTKRMAAGALGLLGPCGDRVRDALIGELTVSKDEWAIRNGTPALMALKTRAIKQIQERLAGRQGK